MYRKNKITIGAIIRLNSFMCSIRHTEYERRRNEKYVYYSVNQNHRFVENSNSHQHIRPSRLLNINT